MLVDDAGGHLAAADVDADAERGHRRRPSRGSAGPQPLAGGQPSTRFFRFFSAPSTIVFSAFRLNSPIIGMLTSTFS